MCCCDNEGVHNKKSVDIRKQNESPPLAIKRKEMIGVLKLSRT
jgi:hypothetical protein